MMAPLISSLDEIYCNCTLFIRDYFIRLRDRSLRFAEILRTKKENAQTEMQFYEIFEEIISKILTKEMSIF